MRKSGLLAGILTIVLLLNGCDAGTTESGSAKSEDSGRQETGADSDTLTEETDENEEFAGIPSCNVGDTVFFGSYEQDNNTENGPEEIEWIVLDTEGGNALLLSKYGLDAQPYNSGSEAVTWENSSLRKWLNDTFYKSAFSESKRKEIVPVTNVNPDNRKWGTSGGNDTEDTIFLLSIDEAEACFPDGDERLWTQATPYAAEQGAFVEENGDSPWWLRSPGNHNDGGFCAAYVDYRPFGVVLGGYGAQNSSRTVRPALWVKTLSDSAPDNSWSEEPQNFPAKLEDCRLRLIDCHPFEDDGEQFTYLAFALLGPEEIGFHLEGVTSEQSDAWLTVNHMKDGWRVVTCKELPAGLTTEELSLSVTDYSTSEEKNVLLSDWGEPMDKEELQAIGIYEIEGKLALAGKGKPVIAGDAYGICFGLGLIGAEFGKPDTSFPELDQAAEVFRFYASDGTSLAQKVGKEMNCYMIRGNVYAMFPLDEGADKDAELEKLAELCPYMEYINAEGETFRFLSDPENR